MLRKSVLPTPKPAVFISGGLDSTILLSHLAEKTSDPIEAIHVRLPGEEEYVFAAEAAKFYGANYHEVYAGGFLKKFLDILPLLEAPRFNLWPMYAYEKARELGCLNVYVAEGLDEHFGGYWNKKRVSYQEYWGGVLEWSLPTHQQLAHIYGVELHSPFIRLPISETYPLWVDPHDSEIDKINLRKAYKGYIPDNVITRRKYAGRLNWEKPEVWDAEIKPVLGIEAPETHEEANQIIRDYFTRRWADAHTTRR